jgi:hypothetical protein
MGVTSWSRATAITGTMNHAKTSFSTDILAGAAISVVYFLAPLRYSLLDFTTLDILSGPMHGGNQLGTFSYNLNVA